MALRTEVSSPFVGAMTKILHSVPLFLVLVILKLQRLFAFTHSVISWCNSERIQTTSFRYFSSKEDVESLWFNEEKIEDDDENYKGLNNGNRIELGGVQQPKTKPNQPSKLIERKRRTVGVGRMGYNTTTLQRADFDPCTYFELNDEVVYSIRLELLRDYYNTHGDLNVPFRYSVNVTDYDSKGRVNGSYLIFLGKWLNTLRRKYKNDPSKIPQIYKKQLDELGMNWEGVGAGRRPTKFRQRCEELRIFVEDHGHDRVPSYGPTKSLGIWVDRIRVETRKFLNGNESSMTQERFEMLKNVGFSVEQNESILYLQNKFDKAWNSGLEQWKQYKEAVDEGQGNTLSKLIDAGIFRWYTEQQIQFRILDARVTLNNRVLKTMLTKRRLDILSREGFDDQDDFIAIPWEGLSSLSFDSRKMLDALKLHKKQFGSAEVTLEQVIAASDQKEAMNLFNFQQRLRWEKMHSSLMHNFTKIDWILNEDMFDISRELEILGFLWSNEAPGSSVAHVLRTEYEWWEMFHDLIRYKETNGDFHLEPHRPWYSKDLQDWLDEQHVSLGRLMNDESIDTKSSMSEVHYTLLVAIGYSCQSNFHSTVSRIPSRKTSVLSLDIDVVHAAQELSDDLADSIAISRLTEGVDKTEQLAWLVRYEALRRIGISNLGHAPIDNQLRQRLLLWIRNQRKQYRNYIEGRKNTLTTRRIDMLNDINFDWKYKEIHDKDTWSEMKSALLQFKTRHGHCFVPLVYPENRKLGEWVHLQRQIYQAKQRGDNIIFPDLISKQNQKELIHLGLDLTMDNLSYGQMAFDMVRLMNSTVSNVEMNIYNVSHHSFDFIYPN